MKYCELCKGLARTYCESDQASLCWNCDVKVHGANFLVARHSRTVLCHACQSPTPWKASGAELGVTVSVCESCVVGGRNRGQGDGEESQGGNDDEIHTDDDDDDEEEEEADRGGEHHDDEEDNDEEVGGDDEEDGDNQVVPWSATPPPAASSSSSEESVSRFGNDGGEASQAFSLKRFREISSDLTSQVFLSLLIFSLVRIKLEKLASFFCSRMNNLESVLSKSYRIASIVRLLNGNTRPRRFGQVPTAETLLLNRGH